MIKMTPIDSVSNDGDTLMKLFASEQIERCCKTFRLS